MNLRVEIGSSRDQPCHCCPDTSRTVTGFLYVDEAAVAAYFVQWTLGAVREHGASFDLIVGRWGEGSVAAERRAVALRLQHGPGGPSFMLIDAGSRPVATSELVGKAMTRTEVIDTPLARQVFAMVDAIWLQDERIAVVRCGAP